MAFRAIATNPSSSPAHRHRQEECFLASSPCKGNKDTTQHENQVAGDVLFLPFYNERPANNPILLWQAEV